MVSAAFVLDLLPVMLTDTYLVKNPCRTFLCRKLQVYYPTIRYQTIDLYVHALSFFSL
jgi:hypothetical protein